MQRRSKLVYIVSAAALALVAMPALADSGGGSMPSAGGSMPGGNSGPTINPVVRYQDGVTALEAKKYKDAQRAFGDVLRVAARDPSTNYMMGLAFAGEEKFKESRRYFENAVKYNADLAQARGWLGVAYAKTGEAAKAAEQKTALVAMKEKCATTCKEAADINDALTRLDAALTTPAASFAPALPKLASAQGDAAYLEASGLINEGRYAEGLASLRQAALVFGPHPDVRERRRVRHVGG